MCLSDIGEIVESEWLKTPGIRPDMQLDLGEFIVMPNHFHGIIVIGENEYNHDRRDAMHRVSTNGLNKFGPQRKNLSSLIRGIKSSVTKRARVIRPNFAWQTRFHDHIIRNDTSFQTIADYIMNNPAKWNDDKYYEF